MWEPRKNVYKKEEKNMENDNVVDTGEEWEVFSIVKIENVEE